MKPIWFFALAAILVAAPIHAQEGGGIKFRGVYINMPKTEVEAIKLDGFTVEFDSSAFAAFKASDAKHKGTDSDGACGVVAFDANDKVSKMILSKCFFNAEDLDDEHFAQSIVDVYPIQTLTCVIKPPDSTAIMVWSQLPVGPAPAPKKICSGYAKTGERVEVSGDRMTVERRTAAQRPTFN